MIRLLIRENLLKRKNIFNHKYAFSIKFNFVSPKKALIILSIAAAIILSVFLGYYFFSGKNSPWSDSRAPESGTGKSPDKIQPEKKDLDEIIEKSNSGQPLTEEEESVLNEAINEKAAEKTGAVQEAAKDRSYTQEEVDTILNPGIEAMEDLGIKNPVNGSGAVPSEPVSQEEIDDILNPKK